MSATELTALQEAIVWVFGPIIIHLAVPFLLAMGVLSAILAGINVLFAHKPRSGIR